MAANGPNSFGIRDNHTRGKVADFLVEKINAGSHLSVVSAYFTIYAYEALSAELDSIGHLNFLFGEPRFIASLDPDKTDKKSFKIEDEGLELANRLQQKEIARRCAAWIREKVEIRSIRQANLLHGKLYHIDDGRREHAILGSSNFTRRGLGLSATPNIELNLIVDGDRDRAELKEWFDQLWADESLVADVKAEVLRYLLGMTVATKQPAMTAQTLAGLLGDIRATRQAELDGLVDMVAAVCRSQLAAIAGNVMMALPVAIAIGFWLGRIEGHPVIALEKGAHLLGDLDPLSWALPHAAIAGFYLFLSGLITGYFDNRAAYRDIGIRIARLRWLRRLSGKARAERIGAYIQDHLGGIMGNFLFGCMLGSTGDLGIILGLPLDIRHIAFSSANLGYALIGFGFALPLKAILWAALGVALIGLTNLAVSFALALRTALGARGVRFEHWGALLKAIWARFCSAPRSFVLPPRGAANDGHG